MLLYLSSQSAFSDTSAAWSRSPWEHGPHGNQEMQPSDSPLAFSSLRVGSCHLPEQRCLKITRCPTASCWLHLPKILQVQLQKYQERSMMYVYLIYLFICLFFRAAPAACGGSQARGRIRPVAARLHQSHSSAGCQPHLRPTPQLTAMLDP